ncbi:hypothetical protein CBR_g28837 [Chara braunii]|uniref:Uncharacterized protein n=1 Tax=Chara braunii TaxID=69332 RepID=A0A388LAB1_CHABU|nr:hypothetical protein CBR_g28837 [Chara braunii]|eukprot:GBG79122.1 hypothetical protein CBR_g28837 [Chara braunii]
MNVPRDASEEVFRKGMEFYDKWAEGKLLGGDGKTPLSKPGKYMPDKSPGLHAIPKMGAKGAAGETKMGWLLRVPLPPTKKKMQSDDKFFVVVKEPDMFCWQSLADTTNAKKLSILDDILALKGVFVQSEGGHLKRQHKPGIKDMVATRKVDRMMLHMFHYILFLKSEEDAKVWRYRSQFFRTEEQLLAEFAPRGLAKRMWVELRKHFHGAVEYVNTCKRCLLYEKESLNKTKKMYDDERFPISFEKSVRSILRQTEKEVQDTIRARGDVRHIKWHKINRVTSLIPFSCPASQAHTRLTEIREIVRHYVYNLYVLDLCDPTLLSDWQEDDFASLQGILQTISPRHWALVVFFPSRWKLGFLKGMAKLSVHHVRTGKWVRHAQRKATVREGNMLVEEYDCLYMVFNGENLADNTVAVFPVSSPSKPPRANAPSPTKPVAATHSKVARSSDPSGQAVACFDVVDEDKFPRSQWEDSDVTSVRGATYGDREHNLAHLIGLLDNFCKVGQTIFFFGKAHASAVWELLRSGRNVVALKDEAKKIDYLCEFVKTRVGNLVQTTGERNWDSKRDMLMMKGKVFLGRRYSTSSAGLKRIFERETVEDQSSDDEEEERDYDAELGDKLPRDHDTWENDRLFFYGKHHRFTPEDVWGHNVVWHPRKFQPAVKTGKWVMAMKEADGKWTGMNRQGAGPFKKKARETLVEHLRVMNPDRSLPNVNAYASQKLDELYANKMLEFQALFYALETAPSRGIDWRMPQTPSGGQHPGGGRRGDGGDSARPGGGGNGGDGLGSGSDEAKGKGAGETSSKPKGSGGKRFGEKESGGKGSGEKGSGGKGLSGKGPCEKRRAFRRPGGGGDGGDGSRSGGDEAKGKGAGETSSEPKGSDEKWSGEKGSSGKGSGGKGLGGKGSGGNRTAFGSHESSGTESRCEGSRDSGMRDKAALRSYRVRVHSHLSARTLFHDADKRKVLEGPAAGVLGSRPSEYDRYASEGASIDFESKNAADPGEEERSQDTHVVHRKEVTQHSPPSRVSDDLDAGVLETGPSGHLSHPSEVVSVDLESKSAPPRGKGDLSQEAHAAQREEETQHWPPHDVREGLDAGVFLRPMLASMIVMLRQGASVNVESKSATALGEEDLLQEAHAVQPEVGSGGGESHCEGSRDSNT